MITNITMTKFFGCLEIRLLELIEEYLQFETIIDSHIERSGDITVYSEKSILEFCSATFNVSILIDDKIFILIDNVSKNYTMEFEDEMKKYARVIGRICEEYILIARKVNPLFKIQGERKTD